MGRGVGGDTLFSAISSLGNSWARACRILLAEIVDKSETRRMLCNSRVSCVFCGEAWDTYIDCGDILLGVKRGHVSGLAC